MSTELYKRVEYLEEIALMLVKQYREDKLQETIDEIKKRRKFITDAQRPKR